MQQGAYLQGRGGDGEIDATVHACQSADVCVLMLGLTANNPKATSQVCPSDTHRMRKAACQAHHPEEQIQRSKMVMIASIAQVHCLAPGRQRSIDCLQMQGQQHMPHSFGQVA